MIEFLFKYHWNLFPGVSIDSGIALATNRRQFLRENSLENVVCETVAILSSGKWDHQYHGRWALTNDKACSHVVLQKATMTSRKKNRLMLVLFILCMMTSLNGNNFRVTVPLSGEFAGHRWIPLTKASDAELWCFLWSTPWINNRELVIWRSLWRHCNEIKSFWIYQHVIII